MSEKDPNKDIRPWVTIGEAVNEMLVKTADAYVDPPKKRERKSNEARMRREGKR